MSTPAQVLVVDGDPADLELTRDLLGGSLRMHSQVEAALCLSEAIEVIGKRSCDAIVLDVQMPVRGGLTALATLHALTDTRNIHVVMLAAGIVDQQAALNAGARLFLRKPFDGLRLVNALIAVIRIKSMQCRSGE